jgi:hypothetical protein
MSAENFRLRWKGKTLGPFTRREIEQKIREHELGLLHEIWNDGNWMTLREFLGSKATPPTESSPPESSLENPSFADPVSPGPLPPPAWLMSGYIAIVILLFLGILGWTQTWTAPSGWAPLLGLGLGLAGGLFGLLTLFQGDKKHGVIIVVLSVLLAFGNMMFT